MSRIILLSCLILATTLACTSSSRDRGGEAENNANNIDMSNNGGTTPGSVWGGSSDSEDGSSGTFGFGDAASTDGGTPDPTAGTIAAADCSTACGKIGECFDDLIEPADLADCSTACAEEATEAEVACISDNSCEGILSDCVGMDELPASSGSCSEACSKIGECFADLIGPADLGECAQGCAEEATQDEVACVAAATCDTLLQDCFDVDDFDPPPPINNGTVTTSDCAEACDLALGCFGDGFPPEEIAAARIECNAACAEESTPAQISCILGSTCDTINDCEIAGGGGGTDDVTVECINACGYLVVECGEFITQDECYADCSGWGNIDDFCIEQSSCASWTDCL